MNETENQGCEETGPAVADSAEPETYSPVYDYTMDDLDRKVVDVFPGKIVRKDLTALMKRGANVPTFVLEYLLGMYCATDDPEMVEQGLERIRRILIENYVRPDESERIKSVIRERGQYTSGPTSMTRTRLTTSLARTPSHPGASQSTLHPRKRSAGPRTPRFTC